MSPSEKVRAMLDEMGVEYDTSEDDTTIFYDVDGNRYTYNVNPESGWAQLYGYNLTPEQAIAATVGNGTDLASRLREVTGLYAFAELFGFDWYDESDWSWHDVACAMADAIDATAGTTMTLDEATEYAEKFMGDYAKALLASTLYVERDEPTDQHEFDVAEQKEEQMTRDLAEALATAVVGTCKLVDNDSGPDMHCTACGGEVDDEYRYFMDSWGYSRCPHCGARIIEKATE